MPALSTEVAPSLEAYAAAAETFVRRMKAHIALVHATSAAFNPAMRDPVTRMGKWVESKLTLHPYVEAPPQLTVEYARQSDASRYFDRIEIHFRPNSGYIAGPGKDRRNYTLSLQLNNERPGLAAQMQVHTPLTPHPGEAAGSRTHSHDCFIDGPEDMPYLLKEWFKVSAVSYAPISAPPTPEPVSMEVAPDVPSEQQRLMQYRRCAEVFIRETMDRIHLIRQIDPAFNPAQRSSFDKLAEHLRYLFEAESMVDYVLEGQDISRPSMSLTQDRDGQGFEIEFQPGLQGGDLEPLHVIKLRMDEDHAGLARLTRAVYHAEIDGDPELKSLIVSSPGGFRQALREWFQDSGGTYAPVVQNRITLG